MTTSRAREAARERGLGMDLGAVPRSVPCPRSSPRTAIGYGSRLCLPASGGFRDPFVPAERICLRWTQADPRSSKPLAGAPGAHSSAKFAKFAEFAQLAHPHLTVRSLGHFTSLLPLSPLPERSEDAPTSPCACPPLAGSPASMGGAGFSLRRGVSCAPLPSPAALVPRAGTGWKPIPRGVPWPLPELARLRRVHLCSSVVESFPPLAALRGGLRAGTWAPSQASKW
jgi:hypothetical protein